jgi:hypothetical protein
MDGPSSRNKPLGSKARSESVTFVPLGRLMSNTTNKQRKNNALAVEGFF